MSPTPSLARASSIGLLTVLWASTQLSPALASGPQHAHLRSSETSRSFTLPAGRATRTFTLRERSGVILVNRITAPHGVRAFVEATIPGLAGARVTSWLVANDPSLACGRTGPVDVCTQGEEWCPMPQATWHFRLVKLGGSAAWIRFDYVVAPPPQGD